MESWGLGFEKAAKQRKELTTTFLEDCENKMVNKLSKEALTEVRKNRKMNKK